MQDKGQGHKADNYCTKKNLTKNTHIQYESLISSFKKVMAKVKFFKSR